MKNTGQDETENQHDVKRKGAKSFIFLLGHKHSLGAPDVTSEKYKG